MKTSKEKIEEERRRRGFFRPDEVVESIVVTKVITAEKAIEYSKQDLARNPLLPLF